MGERILFVDDEPAALDGYKRLLYRDFDVFLAVGGEQGLATVRAFGPFPIIFSDMQMPGMNGAQFLAQVRQAAPDSVRILLTGYTDVDAAIEAVNEGNIFRFLTKPCKKEVLELAISTGLSQYRLREREHQQLVEANEEIRSLAFYDPLTGLPNRRMLLERLSAPPGAGGEGGRSRALLHVDLDNFKQLNDLLGHPSGDLLLREVARRLGDSVSSSDVVARLGGDEFVIVLEHLSAVAEEAAARAESVARRIVDLIAQPCNLADRNHQPSCSIGVTIFAEREQNAEEVLQQAGIAVSQAKAAGRNAVCFFAPALQAAAHARAAIEQDLRLGIEAGQFVLYYQPQVDRGVVIGAEALVRWNHPSQGILPPAVFIPLAEETGLILALGNWVLDAACRQIAAWSRNDETFRLTVAANVSARQLRQPDFVARVLSACDRSGASPANLKLEITESMLVDDVEGVIAKMTELRSHGFQFSLDDFGTGYSSLTYLKRLPLDQLKIDQSFVRDISEGSGGSIVRTIVSLGGALGLSVIAEGVETEEQRDILADLGCHAYQGYLFSRPLPAEQFELLLSTCLHSANAG